MAATRWNVMLNQVRALAAPPAEATDAELLARFVGRLDESAFEALLGRHGPMVLRVARRVLPSDADAEDVFQATFLLLARKAATIRKRTALACWLHGVAHRLALGLRHQQTRRQARETRAANTRHSGDSGAASAWRDLDGVLDDVLAGLPEKYRTPLVYCYLEGRTQEEVAHLLGAPLGTVRGWLARGRELLRQRLVRRGVALSAAGLATTLLASAAAASACTPPARLAAATLQAAPAVAAGRAVWANLPAAVAQLVRQGTTTLLLAKVRNLAVWAILALVVLGGAALTGQALWSGSPPTAVPPTPTTDRRDREPLPGPPADLHSDPLPPGAVARLGTVRFRQEEWVGPFATAPDGKTLAAVAGRSVIFWDAASGRPMRRLTLDAGLHCLAISPDGKFAAVGDDEGVIHLLDAATAKAVRLLLGHRVKGDPYERGVWGVAFAADGQTLVSWASDQTVRVWQVASGQELRQLAGKDDTVHAVAPDGKVLALAHKNTPKVLRLWDVAKNQEVRQLPHPAEVTRVAFTRDGKSLAVAYGDEVGKPGHIALWDDAGKPLATLSGHKAMIFALAFAPDGKSLASGGYDKTLRLWDLGTRKERHPPQKLASPIYQIAFDRDGKSLLSRGAENHVRLWDVDGWREATPVDGPDWGVASLAHSPDGKQVAAVSLRSVWIWEAATGKVVRKLDGHQETVTGAAFTADGKYVVSAARDGTVRVWDRASAKEHHQFRPGGDGIEHMALAPDGLTVATWDFNNGREMVLSHVGTGKKLHVLAVASDQLQARPSLHGLCFSPDSRTLYASSGTHVAVQRWDVATGKALPLLGRHDGGLNGLAMAADGRSLAVVSMGGTLFVWETATGQARLVVKDAGYATGVAFSPNGRWLALANTGGYYFEVKGKVVAKDFENREAVRLVRVADGKVVHQFLGHVGGIGHLGFAPDGRTLASGGHDTTVLLWDVKDAEWARPKEGPPLKDEELAALWAALRGEAGEAHRAMVRLIAFPAQAVPFLAEQVRPLVVVEPARVAALIATLDSPQFAERDEATRELKKLGEAAEPGLRQALKGAGTLETKQRLEAILKELGGPGGVSGERLRTLRALEVLERTGTKEARELVRQLAQGAPGAWLTGEALGSLRRLER
jgi:RNA polymerase sigma factor (sigma-70 family)